MADKNRLANAARLLSQAATSLITSTNSQDKGQPSSSQLPLQAAQQEFRRAFSYNVRESGTKTSTQSQSSTTLRAPTSARSLSFTSRSRGKKRKSKELTLKFFCLADTTQDEVPINEGKRKLLIAGLGEKKMILLENTTSDELHDEVIKAFPKLTEAGGYEFLHTEPSSRSLKIISAGPNGYTVDYLKQFVGQGRVYIRPIQSSLSLDPFSTETPAKRLVPEEFCHGCQNYFPMNKLRSHLEVCVPCNLPDPSTNQGPSSTLEM